jgi:putative transposase
MLVMDQFTRRIIGFAVHAGPVDGPTVCRMFGDAIARAPILLHYLSSDNDPLFEFHRWKANLRVLEVAEIKSVPNVPLSHPFVERLIGTIRRELLDLVPFWNACDLRRKLDELKHYYNRARVHRALAATTPASCCAIDHRTAQLSNFRWESHCRGLYQLPIAA